MNKHEEVLQSVVGRILFNNNNRPESVQRHILGRDFSKLRDALVTELTPLFEGLEMDAHERGFNAGYAERADDEKY